jgi:hypothetical protein
MIEIKPKSRVLIKEHNNNTNPLAIDKTGMVLQSTIYIWMKMLMDSHTKD